MKTEDRKAAITAYKERNAPAGIHALPALHRHWRLLGRPRQRSRHDPQPRAFMLRMATTPPPRLLAGIGRHGAEGFTFKVVKQLKDDLSAQDRDRLLKRAL